MSFSTRSDAFRVEKLLEPSQVDDSSGLKVEGMTVSQDAEWIEDQPKPKQIQSKQTGITFSKMGLVKLLEILWFKLL